MKSYLDLNPAFKKFLYNSTHRWKHFYIVIGGRLCVRLFYFPTYFKYIAKFMPFRQVLLVLKQRDFSFVNAPQKAGVIFFSPITARCVEKHGSLVCHYIDSGIRPKGRFIKDLQGKEHFSKLVNVPEVINKDTSGSPSWYVETMVDGRLFKKSDLKNDVLLDSLGQQLYKMVQGHQFESINDKVLVHGDVKMKNLFVNDETNEVWMVDCDCSHDDHVLFDLFYFMVSIGISKFSDEQLSYIFAMVSRYFKSDENFKRLFIDSSLRDACWSSMETFYATKFAKHEKNKTKYLGTVKRLKEITLNS